MATDTRNPKWKYENQSIKILHVQEFDWKYKTCKWHCLDNSTTVWRGLTDWLTAGVHRVEATTVCGGVSAELDPETVRLGGDGFYCRVATQSRKYRTVLVSVSYLPHAAIHHKPTVSDIEICRMYRVSGRISIRL